MHFKNYTMPFRTTAACYIQWACAYVFVCVHVCACLRTCVFVCGRLRACFRACLCVPTCLRVCVRSYAGACLRVCALMCVNLISMYNIDAICGVSNLRRACMLPARYTGSELVTTTSTTLTNNYVLSYDYTRTVFNR